jgi:hypothetical protein
MLDWKAFESIAYETVDDFQENKEPQLHEDPGRQRQLQRKRPIAGTMRSVVVATATASTTRVPPPLPKNNQKRKWPAHQRRNYLKNKLGVTGTEILRVEFEVRRIQLSRKNEARTFAVEQFVAAKQQRLEQEEEEEIDDNDNSSDFRVGVSPFVDESYALRRYYGKVSDRQQRQEADDEYTYPYDSSLLDAEDDNDDGILEEADKNHHNNHPTSTTFQNASTTEAVVVVVPDVCAISIAPRRQTAYTTMPAGCWHPANDGKGWFISGPKTV